MRKMLSYHNKSNVKPIDYN